MDKRNLYLLDKDKKAICILSNRMPYALPFYNDIQERSLDDLTDTLTFRIPSDHIDAEKVTSDRFVLYPVYQGDYRLYKIKEVKESTGSNYTKEIYAEISGQDDLLRDVVRPMTFKGSTLKEILDAILVGTSWVTGNIDDFGFKDYEISDYPTRLEAVVKVVQEFGGEMQFEYITRGSTVTSQLVSVYSELGERTGAFFTYGKDVKQIERVEDTTKLITAVIPIGKGETNGSKMNLVGFEAKELPKGYEKITGADWIGSISAAENYGDNGNHIFGVYKDDKAQSRYELFDNALATLKKYERPLVTYKAEVAVLERLIGYEHKHVSLGDTIVVQDTSMEPDLIVKARIRKIGRSITNPMNDYVELGDYIPIIPSVNSKILELQNKISEKESIWDSSGEVITKDIIPPLNPKENDLWLNTSVVPNVLNRWNGTEWVKASVSSAEDIGAIGQESLEISEWYSSTKSGGNLLNNISDVSTEGTGYEWTTGTMPDGTVGRVLRKLHVGGSTPNDSSFSIPKVVIDPTKTYLLEFIVLAKDQNSLYSFGREEYDIDDTVQGSGPNIVSAALPTQIDVWKKHYALIPPHYSGLESSHDTVQSIYTPDKEYKFYSSETKKIEVKLQLAYSVIDASVDSEMWAAGFGLYEVGSSDTLYQTITEIGDMIDEKTDPVKIIDTVVYSESFDSIMSQKANVEDISDMATGEMLQSAQEEAIKYIDGRIDGEGGINEAINAVTSALEKTANDINAKFTSSGGINLIKNSIGYVGTDLWELTNEMRSIQNQELEQLGFGSGWYSPLGSTGYIEQKISTSIGTKYSLSLWLKKVGDSTEKADAGVEIYENGTKVAFIGKASGGGVTNGYELGIYTFETNYNEVIVRVTFGTNTEGTISGLMLNVGEHALQWQHANGEIYNTNVQMNLNGIKVINSNTNGYTIMSPQEFSGYAQVVDELTGNSSMQRIFTLNGDTTEVSKIDADKEISMSMIKIVPIASTSYNGWAFISNE